MTTTTSLFRGLFRVKKNPFTLNVLRHLFTLYGEKKATKLNQEAWAKVVNYYGLSRDEWMNKLESETIIYRRQNGSVRIRMERITGGDVWTCSPHS